MIQTLLLCASLLFSTQANTQTSTQDNPSYTLNLTLNGEPVDWYVSESVNRNGDWFQPNGEDTVRVLFDGGSLDLNVADWDTWDHAHVTGVSYQRTGADTYMMSATVRHDDTQEDYADVIHFSGENVANGKRELMHPHINEQPFTRSQSGVTASGEVLVSATDTVQDEGGTTVTLNLDSEMFASDEADLEIELTRD